MSNVQYSIVDEPIAANGGIGSRYGLHLVDSMDKDKALKIKAESRDVARKIIIAARSRSRYWRYKVSILTLVEDGQIYVQIQRLTDPKA